MPKIAASLVCPVSSPPRRNAVVEVDDNGVVLSLGRGNDSFTEQAGVEYYSGILIPGLADMMCGMKSDPHWLFSRGIRIAGRINPGKEDTDIKKGDVLLNSLASWKGFYGGRVDFSVFESEEHFYGNFAPDPTHGIFHKSNGGHDLQVLASHGMGLFELMIGLQLGTGQTDLAEILTMAALNGARALGMDQFAGSIEPGKTPGLNIIEGADIAGMRLLASSRLRRLL